MTYSGNCYKDFPALYDILYRRYLRSAKDFARLVKNNSPKGGRVLDLAAGTGEVSIPLLKAGLRVTSLDASKGMLEQLKLKARKSGVKNASVLVADMERLHFTKAFDTVCIRQAINYFMGRTALQRGLTAIRRALKDGGKCIFNAPNYKGQHAYSSVSSAYHTKRLTAFVVEMNALQNRRMQHHQYAMVWHGREKPICISDKNTFYLFTKREFICALRRAGFRKIDFKESEKTLICIAVA